MIGRPKKLYKTCTMRVPVEFKFQVETGAKSQGMDIPDYLRSSKITISDKVKSE